jgi:fluoroquinolone transport system permease protein
MVYPALTLILFTDICTLGFFFIGAIVLLERGQNLTESLFITPLRLHEYLLAKILSFLFLATLSALLIMLGASIGGKDLMWFVFGAVFSALIYTLFGLIFAARARHVNDYFVKSLGAGLLISLPILAYIRLFDTPLFYLFPTRATLILLDVLGTDYALSEKLFSVASLLIWFLILGSWVYQRFNKYVRHPA